MSPPIIVPLLIVALIAAIGLTGLSSAVREHRVDQSFAVGDRHRLTLGTIWQSGEELLVGMSLTNGSPEPWILTESSIRLIDPDGAGHASALSEPLLVPSFTEAQTILSFSGQDGFLSIFGIEVEAGELIGIDLGHQAETLRRGAVPEVPEEPVYVPLYTAALQHELSGLGRAHISLRQRQDAIDAQLNTALAARDQAFQAAALYLLSEHRWRERERALRARLAVAFREVREHQRIEAVENRERRLLETAVVRLTAHVETNDRAALREALAQAQQKIATRARQLQSDLMQTRDERENQGNQRIEALSAELEEAVHHSIANLNTVLETRAGADAAQSQLEIARLNLEIIEAEKKELQDRLVQVSQRLRHHAAAD